MNDGARLLDIGTGNGAVAIIAADTARKLGRTFEIHAADQCDIDPPRHLRAAGIATEGIVFHARTPAEQMPFPHSSFDVVTGQFALEYSDMDASLGEIARQLKPGGGIRLVLHMRGGHVYEQTRRQISDMVFMRSELRLLDKAIAMMIAVYACERDGKSDAESLENMRQAKGDFFAAAKRLRAASETAAYRELYLDALKIIAHYWNARRQTELKPFLDRAEGLKQEIGMAEQRHRAMCRCALDGDGIKTLERRLRSRGFASISTQIVRTEEAPPANALAWQLSAQFVG